MTPPWTTALPPHWKVEKLKYVAEVRLSNADKKTVEGEQPVRLCNYVDVYKNDFITSAMPFMEASATDSQIRELALHGGDVLITKDSEDWADIAVPAYVPADLPGVICGYHLAHIRPDPAKAHGGYLFRAFTAQSVADQFRVAANGITRYGISKDDIASSLFPVPPLPEQRSIAGYLDRKTAEIDAVVARKERMIDLLRDERQAVISRAVTRGLNPSEPMKDSGTPWLGEVPKQWAVMRIKHVLHSLEQGWSPECESRIAELDEWGIMKAGCVNRGVFNETEHKALPVNVLPIRSFEIRAGDLLVCRASGSPDLVGSAALVTRCRARLLLCDKLFRLHCDHEKASPRYLAAVLNSRLARCQIERDTRGAEGLANNITQSVIRELVFALPSLPEQNQIADYLDSEGQRISGLIAEMTYQLAKLREYRQTLISAAVTGKFTVPVEETPDFRAAVLAAEIIYSHPATKPIGRTKLHKELYATEHECDLVGIDADYARMPFGPYDDRLQKAVERELEARQWYRAVPGERGKVNYVPLAQAGQHRAYFDRFYGEKAEAIARLVGLLRPLNKNKIERAITLYAAWNDFLIRGEPVDDGRLLTEVQKNWHPEKQHKEESWRESLGWLKARKLIPHGFGKPTRPTNVLTGLTTAPEDDAGEADEAE